MIIDENVKNEVHQISQTKSAITVIKWDIFLDSAQINKDRVVEEEDMEVEILKDQDPQLASDVEKKVILLETAIRRILEIPNSEVVEVVVIEIGTVQVLEITHIDNQASLEMVIEDVMTINLQVILYREAIEATDMDRETVVMVAVKEGWREIELGTVKSKVEDNMIVEIMDTITLLEEVVKAGMEEVEKKEVVIEEVIRDEKVEVEVEDTEKGSHMVAEMEEAEEADGMEAIKEEIGAQVAPEDSEQLREEVPTVLEIQDGERIKYRNSTRNREYVKGCVLIDCHKR